MKKVGVVRRAALAVSLSLVCASGAFAAPGDLIVQVLDPHPARADHFGEALTSSDAFFVGAPGTDDGAHDAGFAYEVDELGVITEDYPNPVPQDGAVFGHALTVRGDIYAFSATGADHGAGRVYLFDEATPLGFVANPRLVSHGGDGHGHGHDVTVPHDDFGKAVAFAGVSPATGEILAIGAPRADQAASGDGVVYICDGDETSATFGEVLITLVNPTPESHDSFGAALFGFSDGFLLVGAPGDNTGALNAGSAYLYDCDPTSVDFGSLVLTINNPTPEQHDHFGAALTGVGSDLGISSYRDSQVVSHGDTHGHGHGDVSTHAVGSVYVFDGSLTGQTSSPLLTIPNPNPHEAVQFGISLAGSPESGILVIGANGGRQGVAYIYDGFEEGISSGPLVTLHNPDTHQSSDGFGSTVAQIEFDGTVMVGAPLYDINVHNGRARDAGATYIFEGIPPTE